MSLMRKIVERYTRNRPPDFNVGPGYLLRWWLLPRNKWFNVYLHQFRRDDEDRALHDHMYVNCSIVLIGQYIEHTPHGRFIRKAGSIVFRRPTARHRISLPVVNAGITYCWTLFITGPRVRDWYFHCPQGPVHWQDFTSPTDSSKTGKGCDQ